MWEHGSPAAFARQGTDFLPCDSKVDNFWCVLVGACDGGVRQGKLGDFSVRLLPQLAIDTGRGLFR